MEQWFTIIVALGLMGLLIGVSIWAVLGGRKKALKALQGDPEVESTSPVFFTLKTRAPLRETTLKTFEAEGAFRQAGYLLQSSAPRFGKRTSVHIRRTGLRAALNEMLGFQPVRTGDDAFDERYAVQAGDVAAVVDPLLHPRVREALDALFKLGAYDLQVAPDGRLSCTARRTDSWNLEEARPLILQVARIAELLDENAVDPYGRY